jgi:amino acid adenylation domain-containing protein
MLLHEILESSARKRPNAVAVLALNHTVTYGELDALANRFAHACLREGVRPGDRVALALENSIELIACYFGVMKAGGVAVPLPPGPRSDRLAHAVSDCAPALTVVDVATLPTFMSEWPDARVLVHADKRVPAGSLVPESQLLHTALAASPAQMPSVLRGEDDLAAIVYTSGSTAQPRGVMLTHRNIVANTRSILEYLRLSAADRVMCVLPLYYVYGLSLLHTHMMAGGSIVLENRVAFPSAILRTLQDQEATGFAGVPSTFAFLLRRSALRKTILPHLRYVTQAGAAMVPSLLLEWLDAVPGVPFYAMYGATEASARLTYLTPEDLGRKLGSIGKPVAGVEIDVIADDGRIAASGEIGELVARGENISPGYWNNDTETRARFGPSGYRTGDLGYRDSEGFLFVVGRRHDMLKIGGHRVAPQEIEHVLRDHPAISDAAVVGAADELLGEVPVAFVVLRESAADERGIREFCAARLAAPKVPARVQIVAELPRLASGKIDKPALRLFGQPAADRAPSRDALPVSVFSF